MEVLVGPPVVGDNLEIEWRLVEKAEAFVAEIADHPLH